MGKQSHDRAINLQESLKFGRHTLINSFRAFDNFFRLLLTFANSLDPDEARLYVGPDLDPSCLTL